MLQILADQTNLFALQKLTNIQSYRTDQWYNTDLEEIKRFWSYNTYGNCKLTNDLFVLCKEEGFNLNLPRKIMPTNRFKILLRFLHFSDNTKNDHNSRLTKIDNVINLFNINLKNTRDEEK
jgi:hypothetical protein